MTIGHRHICTVLVSVKVYQHNNKSINDEKVLPVTMIFRIADYVCYYRKQLMMA